MDKKKILVTDYDQTYYLDDEDIKVNNALVREFRSQGNIFVVATGRSYMDIKKTINKYSIDYDYLIINHGATILDHNDNILFNLSIDNSIVLDIEKDLNLEQSISNFCCSCIESRVKFNHKNITKINIKYNTKKEAIKISEIIKQKYSKYVNLEYRDSGTLEIIANQVNKSKTIKFLANKIGIDDKCIYTIGDYYNDFEMVRDYNGFCMKESVKELKNIALKEYNSVSKLVEDILKESL